MASTATTQLRCCTWLNKYFETYGDYAPNRSEIRLLQKQRKSIYQKYKLEQKKLLLTFVSRYLFGRMWKTLFPRSVERPWCSIPGKCSTCANIDTLRRCEEDPTVLEKLSEAHQLHRGGLFMLERMK